MEPGQGDRGSKPTIGFAPTRRSEAARVRVIRPVFFVRETRQGRSWVEEKMQKSPNPGTFSSFRPMFLGMSRVGWSAKSSPEERGEVIRLAGEGVSVRRIAVEVFGDSRYRGRVERILRPTAVGVRPTVAAEGEGEIDLEQL